MILGGKQNLMGGKVPKGPVLDLDRPHRRMIQV